MHLFSHNLEGTALIGARPQTGTINDFEAVLTRRILVRSVQKEAGPGAR
ncbi:hypothetical protein SAMN06265373_110109 [Shimia sagamensis]|uniref:Uncharacterized protein n=1 Tax=Shimia sagamensis TaxID=1566352 RepID=A0ABY1PIC7_9RHOB|nr:hypothetical protein SAMN06265373_110109 [Shimia sagamensis]